MLYKILSRNNHKRRNNTLAIEPTEINNLKHAREGLCQKAWRTPLCKIENTTKTF